MILPAFMHKEQDERMKKAGGQRCHNVKLRRLGKCIQSIQFTIPRYGTWMSILPFHVLGTGLPSSQWMAFTTSR